MATALVPNEQSTNSHMMQCDSPHKLLYITAAASLDDIDVQGITLEALYGRRPRRADETRHANDSHEAQAAYSEGHDERLHIVRPGRLQALAQLRQHNVVRGPLENLQVAIPFL